VEAKLDLKEPAALHIAKAVALAPGNADVKYSEAVVRALRNEPQPALEALEAAIKAGFSADRARRDADLEPLRTDPRYAAALAAKPHRSGM
jgi:hypothetical protein